MTEKVLTLKEVIFATIITGALAALDLFVFPASLFGEIHIADIEPIYLNLIINQWLLIAIGLVAIRYLCPNLNLGLKKSGLKEGVKKYSPSAVLLSVVCLLAYFIGLLDHYNYTPTVWKVLVETFVYNLSVGFIEELYIRGLLLAVISFLFRKKKHGTFIAIVISSVIFSLGHIPGMIWADAFAIIMRLIWTLMIGIYLGIVYKTTNNLWVPIIIHAFINFSGIPFCFTTHRDFPSISVLIIMIISLIIGGWSIYDYFKKGNKDHKLFPPTDDKIENTIQQPPSSADNKNSSDI